MTRIEVLRWIRNRWLIVGRVVRRCRPSTAQLRRWLRDKDTPREVKNWAYGALLYRRRAR